MNEPYRPLSIYLVAAEESGDALGAALANALAAGAQRVQLAGVGGRAMAAAEIVSPFPIEALSIIGVSAIPRRLPTILRRIRETADAIVAARPDGLVIIDSPDFTHRVARRVRARAPSIPILDYVSPSVWAWRAGRARAMRDYVDCVLAILPFEPEVHARLGGPPCVYVGHPLIERLAQLRPNADEAQRRSTDPPLVLVLPGSRGGEIRRLIAIFGATVAEVAARFGPLELVLPTVAHLAADVRAAVANWTIRPRVVVDPEQKWAAFRTARAALAASGTVTLELALAAVPTVAAYRITLLEEMIARALRMRARLPTIILANFVLGDIVVPEFLQRDCTPQNLAGALLLLLRDTPERSRQVEAFAGLDRIMAVETTPSAKAAATVLEVVRKRKDRASRTAES